MTTLVRRLPVALLLGACLATPIHAADTVTGRWALDPAACEAYFFSENAPLVVTDSSVRWKADSCRIGRMYKTGDTVHIQAQCWGEGGERSVPVSLRPHAGRLEVRWDRVRSGDLKRCQ